MDKIDYNTMRMKYELDKLSDFLIRNYREHIREIDSFNKFSESEVDVAIKILTDYKSVIEEYKQKKELLLNMLITEE